MTESFSAMRARQSAVVVVNVTVHLLIPGPNECIHIGRSEGIRLNVLTEALHDANLDVVPLSDHCYVALQSKLVAQPLGNRQPSLGIHFDDLSVVTGHVLKL